MYNIVIYFFFSNLSLPNVSAITRTAMSRMRVVRGAFAGVGRVTGVSTGVGQVISDDSSGGGSDGGRGNRNGIIVYRVRVVFVFRMVLTRLGRRGIVFF